MPADPRMKRPISVYAAADSDHPARTRYLLDVGSML